MELSRVQELIDLMQESGVTQLSLELPDFKVSITRGPEGEKVETEGGYEEQSQAAESAEAEGQAAEARPSEHSLPVVSPVVGVFHNGGMFDPREIVREGDRVREGQVLAAIEAMKVPNELRAPASGVISRMLVDDGAAVEYGQPLLMIEPDREEGPGEGEPPIGVA